MVGRVSGQGQVTLSYRGGIIVRSRRLILYIFVTHVLFVIGYVVQFERHRSLDSSEQTPIGNGLLVIFVKVFQIPNEQPSQQSSVYCFQFDSLIRFDHPFQLAKYD